MYQVITIDTFDDNGVLISTSKKLELSGSKPITEAITSNPVEASVKLVGNTLELNQAAVDLIGAKVGDKICIQYVQIGDVFTPVIGTEQNMGQSLNGNKLTKKLTISYRGKQAEALRIYGDEFTLELHEGKIYKLLGNSDIKILTDADVESSENIAKDLEDKEEIINFDFDLDL
jgi:microcompartment protein CcmK/EutM